MNQQTSPLHIKASHTPYDVICEVEKLFGQLKTLIADAEGKLNKVCVVFIVEKRILYILLMLLVQSVM